MPKNLGQQYEDYIKEILQKKNLLPLIPSYIDAGFIHKGATFYVEVKNNKAPDFGQKGLTWSQAKGWEWRERDVVSEMYDRMGVINQIDKTFVPKRYSVPQENLTAADRTFDQTKFEKSGIVLKDLNYLYEFYARKQCFYIQVEGKGFYFLQQDVAGLGVPQFKPELRLRLRAKTHHSFPIHNYSFFAVITAKRNTIYPSTFDLEDGEGKRKFPPIAQ